MRARLRHHLPALGSIFVRGLGVVAGFGVALIIGRRWGPEANGVYALVTQTAIFLSLLAIGGLDLSITRFFSAARGRGNRVALASLLRLLAVALALVLPIILLVSLAGGWLERLGVLAALPAGLLPLLFVMLAARAFIRIFAAVMRAHRHYLLGQSIDGLFIPVIVLAPLSLGILPDIGSVLDLTAAACAIAAAIGLCASLRAILQQDRSASVEHVRLRPVMIASIPLWGLIIAQNIADWYGLATVAAQHGTHEAGLYRIAMQFASAFTMISMSLFGVYSPQISAAHATHDWPRIARLAKSATRLGIALVLLPAMAFVVAAPWILGFVGSEFVAASTMMRVAIVGQVLLVALGPPGIVLAMVGHERVIFAISLVCTLTMLIVAPFAAEHFGALGVVLALSTVSIGRNVAELAALKRLTGVNGLTGRFAPPAPAAGAARA